MNVTVVLTDQRVTRDLQFVHREKSETYERVNLTLDGNAALVANALRAIADELAPVKPTPAEIADAMAKQSVRARGCCDPGFPCGDHR